MSTRRRLLMYDGSVTGINALPDLFLKSHFYCRLAKPYAYDVPDPHRYWEGTAFAFWLLTKNLDMVWLAFQLFIIYLKS
jgi:hypothetical protein